jgi:hypothetical protein
MIEARDRKALIRANYIRRHWMYYVMLVLPVSYFVVFIPGSSGISLRA